MHRSSLEAKAHDHLFTYNHILLFLHSQQQCNTQALSVLYLPFCSCTAEVALSTSHSLGTGMVAVCTSPCQPLPVRLDLHCAQTEAIGVKQQMASLRLDVLPFVTTRGPCEHKNRHHLQNVPLDLYAHSIYLYLY